MNNSKAALGWLFLLLTSILLMVAGFQGSFGRVLACLLVPGALAVDDGTHASGAQGAASGAASGGSSAGGGF